MEGDFDESRGYRIYANTDDSVNFPLTNEISSVAYNQALSSYIVTELSPIRPLQDGSAYYFMIDCVGTTGPFQNSNIVGGTQSAILPIMSFDVDDDSPDVWQKLTFNGSMTDSEQTLERVTFYWGSGAQNDNSWGYDTPISGDGDFVEREHIYGYVGSQTPWCVGRNTLGFESDEINLTGTSVPQLDIAAIPPFAKLTVTPPSAQLLEQSITMFGAESRSLDAGTGITDYYFSPPFRKVWAVRAGVGTTDYTTTAWFGTGLVPLWDEQGGTNGYLYLGFEDKHHFFVCLINPGTPSGQIGYQLHTGNNVWTTVTGSAVAKVGNLGLTSAGAHLIDYSSAESVINNWVGTAVSGSTFFYMRISNRSSTDIGIISLLAGGQVDGFSNVHIGSNIGFVGTMETFIYVIDGNGLAGLDEFEVQVFDEGTTNLDNLADGIKTIDDPQRNIVSISERGRDGGRIAKINQGPRILTVTGDAHTYDAGSNIPDDISTIKNGYENDNKFLLTHAGTQLECALIERPQFRSGGRFRIYEWELQLYVEP